MKKISFTTVLSFVFFIFSVMSLYSLTGDANADGTVNIVDALLTAQYYVGFTPQGIDLAAMDVNGDGSVNIVDALLIAQYYVGLIQSFPVDSQTPVPTSPPASTNPPSATSLPTAAGTSAPGGVTPSPATPAPGGTPMPAVTPDPDESSFFYFSYDDSASTAGVELAKYQLNNGAIPDPGLARPWEFLNYEEFDPAITDNIGLFDVSMGLWERYSLKEGYEKEYKLGVYVASPVITKESRKNVVLTLIVDISGSMGSYAIQVDNERYTRMDIVKYGLTALTNSLKDGDVINIATFQTTATIAQEGLRIPEDLNAYTAAVDALAPTGSTNLADGIDKGYQAALATYDREKTNRVVILTDAYANTGEIDPQVIAQHVIINDQEGIYFSGLGISENFQEEFLQQLTDAGKGAYFSVITLTDARKAFQDRFAALLMVAAKDVQFRMDYPAVLEHDITAAEETSTEPSEVQPINFSYNTTQYFFEGFQLETDELASDRIFKLIISYKDPENGTEITEVYEKTVSELLGRDMDLIRDAETIYLFTQLIGKQKTWGEISPVFSTYYQDYSSALFEEYWNLIKIYIGDSFEVSPASLDFGEVLIGDSLIKTVTIANNTLESVEIYEIYLEDTDPLNPFDIEAGFPATLDTLEVLNIRVSFQSDIEGEYENGMVIDSSYDEEPITVPLSGAAVNEIDTSTPTPVPPDVTNPPTAVPTPAP